jgi:formamidopyrimidine-DNA glycosylase
MPELPEVETTRRGVAPHVEGHKVTAVRIYDHRLRWPVPSDLAKRLVGRKIDRVERRSKYLLFRVGRATLIIHLGMTGSLRVYQRAPARRPHDHVDFDFDNDVTLRYHDPRRFGAVLWAQGTTAAHPLLAHLGPEPLMPDFDAAYLYAATRNRRTGIKQVIMDSQVVVGVGNIYANEALFRAGIRPTRSANRIAPQRMARLVEAIRDTLTEAIAQGGSTLRDYVDSDGRPGDFQLGYHVYGRSGLACRTCSGPISTTRTGGRATFYCARCQR